MGDLAALLSAPFVLVRAEVVVLRAGVGDQLVHYFELGVAEGDLGFGLVMAAGDAPVAGTFACLDVAATAAA
jgi:hypothetical protein